ncbi:MAG TPA: GNAT family N-acetyltransferase [Clostridiaceae bacterium]|nr:GNAT family N-acetyltransferase [Clostridiaceae bacterium]
MEKQTYLLNPTGASSLCFWKTNAFDIPAHMRVVSDDDFSENLLKNYTDDLYFKLLHKLKHIDAIALPEGFVVTQGSTEEFAAHINAAYEHEGVTVEELEQYRARPVYDGDLWICIRDTSSMKVVASGIAELDRDIGEGSLEWIQVSEGYRQIGLGSCIVNELLSRLKDNAEFVTVSGRVNNETRPEKLYEQCGFYDKTLWHILTWKT